MENVKQKTHSLCVWHPHEWESSSLRSAKNALMHAPIIIFFAFISSVYALFLATKFNIINSTTIRTSHISMMETNVCKILSDCVGSWLCQLMHFEYKIRFCCSHRLINVAFDIVFICHTSANIYSATTRERGKSNKRIIDFLTQCLSQTNAYDSILLIHNVFVCYVRCMCGEVYLWCFFVINHKCRRFCCYLSILWVGFLYFAVWWLRIMIWCSFNWIVIVCMYVGARERG